mgnify:CR=1 FL=1
MELTPAQINSLTFVIYLATVIFAAQMFLALHNIYAFLYKQGKYRTLPLLVFYVLTVVLTGLRLFYNLWFFRNLVVEYDFVMLGMPLVKINMGLNQCWMLIELNLRVRLSLRMATNNSDDLDSSSIETED